jgi:hypothetical protein
MFSVSTMRTTCKSRTSAQNLHHPPAKPLSFLAAALHVTQLSPINPIIVISDILTQKMRVCRVASSRLWWKLLPECYDDAHQGEQDTQP